MSIRNRIRVGNQVGVRGGASVPGQKSYIAFLAQQGAIALWPLNETSGTIANGSFNNLNLTYLNTTLNQSTFLNGNPVPLFDGVTDVVKAVGAQITAINALFSGVAGTLMAWMKVSSSAVHSDGVIRYGFIVTVDGSNQVYIRKIATANSFLVNYAAGGTAKNVTITSSSTAWIQFMITWDKNAGANGEVKAYLNGVQSGATQTALGTWAGPVAAVDVGAVNDAGSNCFDGFIAYPAIWTRALSAAEVLANYRFLVAA